jgi:methionyl-tRNA synthetase
MAKFYITNAIPYANASPHVGHALEFVQSDTIARYHKILGDETLLLCGGDENALKNVQAAEQAGVPVQEFVDTNTKKFYDLSKKLTVQFDVWQKGSDQSTHFPSSQNLWELCSKNGDIYKKSYTGLYCIGCEVFYTREELDENGECFEHPGKKLEEISEENYFFKLSKYQKQLITLLETMKCYLLLNKAFQILVFPDPMKGRKTGVFRSPMIITKECMFGSMHLIYIRAVLGLIGMKKCTKNGGLLTCM